MGNVAKSAERLNMHFTDNVIVETLTDGELDSLIVNLHLLDHAMTSFESDLLTLAETEQGSRNDTISVAGRDEEDEVEFNLGFD